MENFRWIGDKLDCYRDLIRTIHSLDQSFVHRQVRERDLFVSHEDIILEHRYPHNDACFKNRLRVLDSVRNGSFTLTGIESLKHLHSMLFDGLEKAGEFSPQQSHLYSDEDGNVLVYRSFAIPEERMTNLLRAFDEYNRSILDEPELAIVAILCLFIRIQNIHPFLDGNGRSGRLMIQILMYQNGFKNALDIPLEYYYMRYIHIYEKKYPFSREYSYDADFSEIIPFLLKLIRVSYSDNV